MPRRETSAAGGWIMALGVVVLTSALLFFSTDLSSKRYGRLMIAYGAGTAILAHGFRVWIREGDEG